MSLLAYFLREALKRIPAIERLNRAWKARRFKQDLAVLRASYAEKAACEGLCYDERGALRAARESIFQTRRDGFDCRSRLRVFWVGANYDQDRSGFLQALERRCDVTCLMRGDGGYGLSYWDRHGHVQVYDPKIVATNDASILAQVRAAIDAGGIDLLMGQMWANYVSKEALGQIRSWGVPVINISMDDRLPDNWKTIRGCRLGAVGLATSVDLILTTTAEACQWYEVEKCPSLFWPLASDPSVFSPPSGVVRDIDVLFIGNRYGIRSRIVEFLISNGIEVSAWGGGWPNGYATAEQSAALFKRAKIILGIGTVAYCDDVYTLKLRDFDAPMSGALYVTHRNPDLLRLYRDGEEIVCYESDRECADKIGYYLARPEERLRIARAGRAKATERDGWDRRIGETFELLGLLQAAN